MAKSYRETYREKLEDPRWQKKRLSVLNRDGWECIECGSTDKQLHVHHTIYRGGAEPWEYDDDELQTLCKDCHKGASQLTKELKELLALAAQLGAGLAPLHQTVGYLRAMVAEGGADFLAEDHAQCVGAADYFGVHPDIVVDIAVARGDKVSEADIAQAWLANPRHPRKEPKKDG